MSRRLKYCHAINEALVEAMTRHASVYVIGLGVPDAKGVFESTSELLPRFGPERVMDMPASENALTGIVMGSSLVGMRPVLVHQRIDFAILSLDQIVNQAAKWHYMFGGKQSVPIVIRMIVGRGWGQGSQHAQSLQSWFAHVPGLKVIMPAMPRDAKGMLLSAIEDDNPVISIEHRWLFNIEGPVEDGYFRVPIGAAHVIREGTDLTIASISHMTIESLRAAEVLASQGISAQVLDLRTLRPLDRESILDCVRKTGRLLVADTGWKSFGASAEIIAVAVESAFDALRCAPSRVTLPDCSSPSTPALARHFFPRVHDIVNAARKLLDLPPAPPPEEIPGGIPHDVPDNHFLGPF